tara:strand:+ start:18854 stop:19183 length:330 start_codon:yes stop_codon:yes gene_type:complete
MSQEIYDQDDDTWPLVVCQWKDAHSGSDSSWTNTDTYKPEEVHVLSTGWVWPKCLEGHLTLVSSTIGEPIEPESGGLMVGDILHIPWENILAVFSLQVCVPVNWLSEDF